MKRLLIVLVVIFTAFSAFSLDFASFQTSYEEFAKDVATSLPFNSSLGLGWSDAYIGQLIALPPHFGVGLTVGFTTMPYAAVNKVLTALGNLPLPSGLDFAKNSGMPIPAYTLEARVGGFFLPFDLGVKIGVLTPDMMNLEGFSAEYLLAGADVRYALLQENALLPTISIGAGFNYMKGKIALGGLMPGGITLDTIDAAGTIGGPFALTLSDPALAFDWTANVFDLKVQVSKRLLFIITPYIGAAASYASSSAGGGLSSSLLVNGIAPTTQQINDITHYLEATGGNKIDLSSVGITVLKSVSGWAFRVYGGVSLNILIIRLDLGAMYNLSSGSIGASGNARIQF